MMEMEIIDIMLFVKSIKTQSTHFNILDHVQFCAQPTQSNLKVKLKQLLCRNNRHYFSRIVRVWNSFSFDPLFQ